MGMEKISTSRHPTILKGMALSKGLIEGSCSLSC